MKIEHVALYVTDLEKAKDFFVTFLNGKQMTTTTIPKQISDLTSFRLTTEPAWNL